jgi:hypothetical protein
VRNGQSAVVRVPTGLALIVPLKSGLDTGRLRVYVSESGDLRQDAALLTDETGVITKRLQVLGHEIELEAGSDTTVYVTLAIGDLDAQIALSDETDPSKVDPSKLSFEGKKALELEDAKELIK